MFRRQLRFRKELWETVKSDDFKPVYPLVAVIGLSGCIVSYYMYHQLTYSPDVILSYSRRHKHTEDGILPNAEDGIKAQHEIEDTYNLVNNMKKSWPWNNFFTI